MTPGYGGGIEMVVIIAAVAAIVAWFLVPTLTDMRG
jgi:hypothetical protein